MAGKVGVMIPSAQIGDMHGPGIALHDDGHAGHKSPNMVLVFSSEQDAAAARKLLVEAFAKAKAVSANR